MAEEAKLIIIVQEGGPAPTLGTGTGPAGGMGEEPGTPRRRSRRSRKGEETGLSISEIVDDVGRAIAISYVARSLVSRPATIAGGGSAGGGFTPSVGPRIINVDRLLIYAPKAVVVAQAAMTMGGGSPTSAGPALGYRGGAVDFPTVPARYPPPGPEGIPVMFWPGRLPPVPGGPGERGFQLRYPPPAVIGQATAIGGTAPEGGMAFASLLPSLAALGTVASVAEDALDILATAFFETVKMIEKARGRYGDINPQIAIAEARSDIINLLGDIRRGREVAPSISDYIRAKTEFEQKYEDAKIQFIKYVTPFVSGVFRVLTETMPAKETVENIMGFLTRFSVEASPLAPLLKELLKRFSKEPEVEGIAADIVFTTPNPIKDFLPETD